MKTATRDRTLERIATMLVALAVLAERAAGRSLPVRWLVLAFLRRADAYVAEATGWEWPSLRETGETGNDPADAILLGARLRALAAWLAALLHALQPFPDHARVVERALRRPAPRFAGVGVACAGWTGRLNDTS